MINILHRWMTWTFAPIIRHISSAISIPAIIQSQTRATWNISLHPCQLHISTSAQHSEFGCVSALCVAAAVAQLPRTHASEHMQSALIEWNGTWHVNRLFRLSVRQLLRQYAIAMPEKDKAGIETSCVMRESRIETNARSTFQLKQREWCIRRYEQA